MLMRRLVSALACMGMIPCHAVDYQHGYSFLSPLKYPADFAHFEYVNPAAPKGGELRMGEMGNWDNFNAITQKGRDAAGVDFWTERNLIYDRLLEQAIDQPTARYGRLAEGVAVADDGAWIGFKLREGARWHDGVPITVDDLVFSFRTYRDLSAPTIRMPLSVFEDIEVVGEREVRYHVKPHARGNPVLPLRLGNLPVMPKHYWADRDITKTTIEPPLGSGPYRIADFRVGRYVRYERVPDYWGRDLPVNRGRYNFQFVKFDYFRDDQVLYEAVKGDAIDVRDETVPRRWATGYDFPAARRGHFKTEMLELARPAGLWWPIFWNLRQARFQDVRVREALWLLFDFQWNNRVLSFDYWEQGTSFFHNSLMAHQGVPLGEELELLEAVRGQVPERVFTQPFEPPPHGGEGWHRDNILHAMSLLTQAGWIVRDNALVHERTGEQFRIRFVAVSPALAGSFIPYMNVLERVGIESTVKSPEISNWLYRMRSGDFDAGSIAFMPDYTPTLLIRNSFSSAAAEQAYSYNWAHLKDPAVDFLIDKVDAAKTEGDFLAATRALDRVLLWNFYFIPGMSKTRYALVHWDRFGRPLHEPLQRPAFLDTWWWDVDKAERITARRKER